MNGSPEERQNRGVLRRIFGAAGCVVFLALAFTMGTESSRARSTGVPMSNWKGGTMAYQDGFKLTAVFVAFAIGFGYFAVRPKGNP